MDYKKVYDKIIQNRLENPLTDDEYGERHHIIPRSLGGGDETENLVKLTAREHFICHALLAEMYEKDSFEWHKMNHAFMMMKAEMINQQRYFNSRLYELKRKDFSKVMSEAQSGEKNSQYGKPRSDGTKKKISDTHRSKFPNKISRKEQKEIKRLEHQKKVDYRREYYNKLYNDYKQSDIPSLNQFVKTTDYPYSLVNLVKSFVKCVDGYKKTQGMAK